MESGVPTLPVRAAVYRHDLSAADAASTAAARAAVDEDVKLDGTMEEAPKAAAATACCWWWWCAAAADTYGYILELTRAALGGGEDDDDVDE